MTDRLLTFDIALTTGWASDRPSGGEVPVTGHFTVDADGGEAHGRAAFHWRREALGLIALHRPTVIAYEAPLPERFGNRTLHSFAGAQVLLGLCFVCNMVAFEAGIEIFACDVGSVRTHFCGSRFAKKDDVMHRCRVLGYPFKTDDEADAAALWDYSRSTLRAGEVLAKAARA